MNNVYNSFVWHKNAISLDARSYVYVWLHIQLGGKMAYTDRVVLFYLLWYLGSTFACDNCSKHLRRRNVYCVYEANRKLIELWRDVQLSFRKYHELKKANCTATTVSCDTMINRLVNLLNRASAAEKLPRYLVYALMYEWYYVFWLHL